MVKIAVALIMLSGPSGHVIMLNPEAVASMHAAKPGKPNEHVTGEARCVINTWDGKFISVVETCDDVKTLMEATR